MKNKRMWKYIGIGIGVLVVLGIIFAVKAKGGALPELTTAPVEQKNLTQSVSETGTVEADVKVEYGWEKSGRVVSIAKKVGDQVKKGDLIAALDGTSERTNLAQSVASLRSAEANLNVKFAGPTPENLKSAQANVDKAKAGLADAEANVQKTELNNQNSIQQAQRAVETAQNNLRSIEGGENSQIINDAYEDFVNSLKSTLTSLNQALLEADNILGVDNLFANDEYENVLGKQNGSALEIAKTSYAVAKYSIGQAQPKVLALTGSSDHSTVDSVRTVVDKAVLDMQRNLADVNAVLVATLPGNSLSSSELAALKTGILTEQGSLNTSASAITNAEQSVSSARNSLTSFKIAFDKATQDLENTKKQAEVQKTLASSNVISYQALLTQAEASLSTLVSKPREVDIASLRADVSRNRATVANAQNEVAKTELRALADGVLSKLGVEVGETVTMNSPVATILSTGLAIKVDISEAEIAKVTLQDKATLTLDALGDDVKFTGVVASIEPAETKVSGVVYYKTTVVFDKEQPRIAEVRPGMTANVTITTDTRENVLVVPGRSILEKNGTKIVRVVTDKQKGKFEEREVKVGLKGDNGETEIVEGVASGQEVVTFIKEK